MDNVRKRGSTWTYYLYVTEGDGSRRQISKGGFKTRKDAEAERIKSLAALQDATFVRPERVSLREYLLDEWLPTQRPPTLEQSTYHSYERNLHNHVVPYIGCIGLQQLTPMDLNNLYRQLLDAGRRHPLPPGRLHDQAMVDRVALLKAKGLTWQQVADAVAAELPAEAGISRHAVAALHRRSQNPVRKRQAEPGLKPRTVRYVHTILHAALRDALRWNRVARNVAHAANPPSVGSTRNGRPEAWTANDLGAFLEFVADDRYLPPWLFLATTGCRRGEALGIKWTDLDFDDQTAVISRQVTCVNHQIHIKPLTKTKRGHLIRLDQDTLQMLRHWRARQNQEKLLAGPGYTDDGFVFAHPDGRVYHPDRFSTEFLRKQDRYNREHPDQPLPRLVLHGLRHTWATLALHEGIDIQIVSERLNHSSTHVTREIYTHVTPPMQSDAADRVAARIFGRRGRA
ncbi:MAG: putative phage integrase related protein [Acidimicrobiales bacterium]|nr:putative phage integrase related protein [Acidimicrobiales bacterium]